MGDDLAREVAEARRLARRATDLGKDDAVALCWGGYALSYVAGDVDSGRVYIDQALSLNPNLAAAWNFSGWIRIMLGEHQSAIERFERALRLSPRDPTVFHMRTGIAYASLLAGHYNTASLVARDALRGQTWLGGLRILAASKALAGQLDEAREAIDRLLEIDPALRISNLKDRISPLQPEDFTKYADGLRKAGLPE
jgi:tetratricopeptide (TPR) repeat protein